MVAEALFALENRVAALSGGWFYSGFPQYMVGVPGTSHARLGAQHNI